MALTGFAELTLEARDLDRLERFYSETLGLELLKREDDRVWLAAGREARVGPSRPGAREGGRQAARLGSASGRTARRSSATRAAGTCTSRSPRSPARSTR